MKKSLFLLFIALVSWMSVTSQEKVVYDNNLKSALIIIDVQEFYFDEERAPLVDRFKALGNTEKLLAVLRNSNAEIIHVRHGDKSPIRPEIEPKSNEKIITKNKVNSFVDTDLEAYLKEKGIEQLVICGMMTHMCVEGAVRAAADMGFKVIVPSDACATRDLKFNDVVIPAKQVHAQSLQSFEYGGYAKVIDTKKLIEEIR